MSVSRKILEELYQFSIPEICDGMGLYNTMDYHIKPMVTQKKIVGPAFPIKVPIGEGAIIADALRKVNAGDIIVIAGNGNCQSSYWGDHRSICAKFVKAEGVVIDGAFRDIDACEEVDFPIYARAITPGTALKSGVGEYNVTVSCGGVVVNPGDIIVGDRNGVCVLSPDEEMIKEIIAKAKRKKEAQEWTIQEMYKTGVVMAKVVYHKEKKE